VIVVSVCIVAPKGLPRLTMMVHITSTPYGQLAGTTSAEAPMVTPEAQRMSTPPADFKTWITARSPPDHGRVASR
jgi:hypothetical protein